jgi:hypothetical protein
MASFVNIMRYAQDAKRSSYARNIAGGRVAFATLGWGYLNANYRSLRIPAAVGHHVSLLRFFRRWRYFILLSFVAAGCLCPNLHRIRLRTTTVATITH